MVELNLNASQELSGYQTSVPEAVRQEEVRKKGGKRRFYE